MVDSQCSLVPRCPGPCLPSMPARCCAPPPRLPQLHPWAFEEAAKGKLQLTSRMNEGYDHRWVGLGSWGGRTRLAKACYSRKLSKQPDTLCFSYSPTLLSIFPARSYFTIASFVSDHLDFHAQYLLASGPRI